MAMYKTQPCEDTQINLNNIFLHLPSFNLNVESLSFNKGVYVLVLDGELPQDQIEHLLLEEI